MCPANGMHWVVFTIGHFLLISNQQFANSRKKRVITPGSEGASHSHAAGPDSSDPASASQQGSKLSLDRAPTLEEVPSLAEVRAKRPSGDCVSCAFFAVHKYRQMTRHGWRVCIIRHVILDSPLVRVF